MNRQLVRRLLPVLTLSIVILLPLPAAAQSNDESVVAAYIEAGGNGVFYSLNYEARFRDHVSGRMGITFINETVRNTDSSEELDVAVTLLPLMVNGLIGRGSTRIEVGAGPIFAVRGTGVEEVGYASATLELPKTLGLAGITTALGVRYHPRDGGPVFRATLTPFYSGQLRLWGGLSFGWAM